MSLSESTNPLHKTEELVDFGNVDVLAEVIFMWMERFSIKALRVANSQSVTITREFSKLLFCSQRFLMKVNNFLYVSARLFIKRA